MSATPANPFSQLLSVATERERRRALIIAAAVRAALITAATVIELVLVAVGVSQPRYYLPGLTCYAAIALLLFAVRKHPVSPRLSWVPALVDVGAIYALMREAIAAGDNATMVAAFSVGPFAAMLVLSGLTLRPRVVWLSAAGCLVGVVLLSVRAGMGVERMMAAALVLGLVAVVTSVALRRVRFLAVDLAQAEVARQLELRRLTEVDAARQTIEVMLTEARARNEQLERLQREKDSLVQLIVHDLRSPLNAVMLSIEYLDMHLAGQGAPVDVRAAVEDARSTSARIAAMLAQILDTARLEEGRMPIERIPIDTLGLLSEVRGLMAPVSRDKGIEVALQAPADLALHGDPRLVGRVLENLLSNSIRHTPAGGRILIAGQQEGPNCVLSVNNTGAPIQPADRERIFQKFEQGADGARLAGWGLGLYFCRLVAEAHGGVICVEEVAGWPASFVLRLPVERGMGQDAHAAAR